MPDRAMTSQEIDTFLNETHVADLATLKRDGSPHVAPVWYEYDGEKVYFIAGDSAVKVRNVRRDPRVMVSIATRDEPYKYVLIEGNGEVITGDDVEKTTLSLCIRYRGQEQGTGFAREILAGGGTVVVAVRPTKMITWVSGD